MDVSWIIPAAFWVIVVILFYYEDRVFPLVLVAIWLAVTFLFAHFGWVIGSIAVRGMLAVVAMLRLKLRLGV